MTRPSSLTGLSLGDIQRELTRRQRSGQTLMRRRAQLAAKLQALDAQIADLGLAIPARGNGKLPPGKHYKNEMTLPDALVKALKGKTMGISEAMEAVTKVGYRSTAKNFRNVVSIALMTSGKFKRKGRGRYATK